jgi:hypothetical protein
VEAAFAPSLHPGRLGGADRRVDTRAVARSEAVARVGANLYALPRVGARAPGLRSRHARERSSADRYGSIAGSVIGSDASGDRRREQKNRRWKDASKPRHGGGTLVPSRSSAKGEVALVPASRYVHFGVSLRVAVLHLAAAFDARRGPDGITVRDWGVLFVAMRT